ncbi:MAG TPA: helix-turn-helix transcriptional regulator [Chloroflexota bacterium]|nr:helix-turn-helix transcriptional regulator [Chloroflexota bacterium]
MSQPAPRTFCLTEHQTNDTIFRLEERKYGHRLTSEQLAQKANVSLDFVNCLENQRKVTDPRALDRLPHALGITPDLLVKIGGWIPISQSEWAMLQDCLTSSPAGKPVPPQCERIGFKGT